MSLYNAFVSAVAKGYCAIRGDGMFRNLRELEQNQWLSRAELDEITNRELRALIHHAYETVPYYRQVFDERGLKPSDIRCTADLQKLPVLTKQVLKENVDELICPAYQDQLEWRATGGSTGEPMRFALPPEVKQWGRAAALRAWACAGYRLGDKRLLLWGSTFDLKRLFSLGGRLERWANRTCLLNGHMMSHDICTDYVARMRRFRPEVFLGYANSLYILASYMLRNNITDIRPRTVLSAAETLLPAYRTTIEEAFQCGVYDGYGSRETSLYASQCEEKAMYHISSDTTVMEIIKEGRPAAPGEMGKVLVTDLKNYGMPFIRYQIEDVAVAGDEPCSCGRSLPTFRSIEGRMSNIVSLPDGRLVHPIYMMYLMYPDPAQDWGSEERPIEGVDRYQIIQAAPEEFCVKIIREANTNVDYSYIIDNFKQFLGQNTKVGLDFVDDIPASASGKRQYVLSKVAAEL